MQIFLITIVICTWLVPSHQSVSKEAVSAMMLAYISAGSDITEFYSNIDDPHLKENSSLINGIIGKINFY